MISPRLHLFSQDYFLKKGSFPNGLEIQQAALPQQQQLWIRNNAREFLPGSWMCRVLEVAPIMASRAGNTFTKSQYFLIYSQQGSTAIWICRDCFCQKHKSGPSGTGTKHWKRLLSSSLTRQNMKISKTALEGHSLGKCSKGKSKSKLTFYSIRETQN